MLIKILKNIFKPENESQNHFFVQNEYEAQDISND